MTHDEAFALVVGMLVSGFSVKYMRAAMRDQPKTWSFYLLVVPGGKA